MDKIVRLDLSAEAVPSAVTTAAFRIGEAEVTLGQTLFAASVSKSLQYAVETIAAAIKYSSVAALTQFLARIFKENTHEARGVVTMVVNC